MEKIIGVGNALVDVLVQIKDDSILAEFGLPKGSMQLIDEQTFDRISTRMSTMDTETTTGGSAANTMLALAHLGEEPGFIGKIGKDNYGCFFSDNAKQCGITPFLMTDSLPTGVASTFVSTDGQRTFGTFLGAAALMQAEDIQPTFFDGYKILYVEGYLVQSHEMIEHTMKEAKKAGLKICLDLASYNIVEADHDFFVYLLTNYIDIVFANEEESKAFSGKPPYEALDELASLCEIAVVKLGPDGVLVKRGDEVVEAKASPVEKVIDTTAAGDYFAGGFLYGYIHHGTLLQCAEIGGELAGEVIQVVGTKLTNTAWKIVRERIKQIMKE